MAACRPNRHTLPYNCASPNPRCRRMTSAPAPVLFHPPDHFPTSHPWRILRSLQRRMNRRLPAWLVSHAASGTSSLLPFLPLISSPPRTTPPPPSATRPWCFTPPPTAAPGRSRRWPAAGILRIVLHADSEPDSARPCPPAQPITSRWEKRLNSPTVPTPSAPHPCSFACPWLHPQSSSLCPRIVCPRRVWCFMPP